MQHGDQHEMTRRFLASELVKALRMGDKYWRPVIIEDEIGDELLELEFGEPDVADPSTWGDRAAFRVVGAGGRGSSQIADYWVLKHTTRTTILGSAAGPFTLFRHSITLSEPAYDEVLEQLQGLGLYCGMCHGRMNLGGKTRWLTNEDGYEYQVRLQWDLSNERKCRGMNNLCALNRLLTSMHHVFVTQADAVVRNAKYVSEEETHIALMFIDEAQWREKEKRPKNEMRKLEPRKRVKRG